MFILFTLHILILLYFNIWNYHKL